MKRFIVAAAAVLIVGTTALAQGPRGECPGGGFGGTHGPRRGAGFDPATVTTTSGTVESVDSAAPGRARGVHVQLSTADGTLEVRLGPAWFLDQQKVTIQKGDRIEVTGSKIHLANGESLIAQRVRKGEATLTLRDESGIPAWAGRGRR